MLESYIFSRKSGQTWLPAVYTTKKPTRPGIQISLADLVPSDDPPL
jgi:hypothetical protein